MKVVIVGGGLVGSLAACYFAKRGEVVEVYELRKDPRKNPAQRGRSINLALSTRGLAALEAVGLDGLARKEMIPMSGRMLHSLDGSQRRVQYGAYGEAINSIDRKLLNELLLTEAERNPKVTVYFEHDLQKVDLDATKVTFLDKSSGKTTITQGDLIVGADGTYSSLRRELMRRTRMNYQQFYIEHGYMELCIPPTSKGEYAMDPNALHIWPRHEFMMIALPNTDCSFTVTLFMPFAKFEAIQTEEQLFEFFRAEFPDSLPLIGEAELSKLFFSNPVGPLMTVKCTPYHYKGNCVIVGDASHAMTPFYGQGMNCGFEDIQVLDSFLYGSNGDSFGDLSKCLAAYSEHRHPDVTAMCDLALNNYMEMRSSVLSWSYYARKYVEEALYRVWPRSVIPLYTMVSFSRIRYSEVVKRWRRQTFWIHVASSCVIGAMAGMGVWLSRKCLLSNAARAIVPVTENVPVAPANAASNVSALIVKVGGWLEPSVGRVKSWITSS